MLSWWLNRPTDGDRVQDEDLVQEPPETPAPVFAARALKSAFFGTPAPPAEDTSVEIKTERETFADKDTRNSKCHNISPTKPPGILLTPGTATTRRKTVSFGTEVPDKNEQNAEGEAGLEGRQSVPKQKEQSSSKGYRKTPLTKSLELARETKPGKNKFERKQNSSEPQPLIELGQETTGPHDVAATRLNTTKSSTSQKSNQDLLQEFTSGDDIDGDMTMDLNEPHSQSGQYWKTEYEQYHGEAKTEMQKLLKYKQLAKSYAKKKDAETLVLTEKLKEEHRRVISLEDKLSRISAQITTTGYEGNGDGSPELTRELAKQSALALEYKAQAEELRATIEGNAGQAIAGGENAISSRTKEPLTDTRRDLRTTREQQRDLALRQEMRDLRQILSTAQQNGLKLQEENTRVAQELLNTALRLEEQEDKSERRLQATEEQLQKKTEALKLLQQDYAALKVKAKAQRGNAEHILKRKHDQAQELRKELASMRRAELAAKGSQQQKPFEVREIATDQQKPNVGNKVGDVRGKRSDPMETTLMQARKKFDIEIKSRHIPVLTQPLSVATKSPTYCIQANIESADRSPTPQAPHNALSEIVNNSSTERVSSKSSTMERTPLSRRISNMSRETPNIELPSPEPFLSHITGHVAHDRKSKHSPRPSMFTFGSSPPKPDIGRSHALDKLTRPRSDGNLGGERDVLMASTRLPSLSGSRTRTVLPPERAAAARARLEKKNAEKKAKTLRTEDENTQNW